MILNILNNLVNKEKINESTPLKEEVIKQRGYFIGWTKYGYLDKYWIHTVAIKDFSEKAGLPITLHCYSDQSSKSKVENRIFFKTKEDAQKFIDEFWNKEYEKEGVELDIFESKSVLNLVKIDDKWNVYVTSLCLKQNEIYFKNKEVKDLENINLNFDDYLKSDFSMDYIYADYDIKCKNIRSNSALISISGDNLNDSLYTNIYLGISIKSSDNKLCIKEAHCWLRSKPICEFDYRKYSDIVDPAYKPSQERAYINNYIKQSLAPSLIENNIRYETTFRVWDGIASIDLESENLKNLFSSCNHKYDINNEEEYKKFISEFMELIINYLDTIKNKQTPKNYVNNIVKELDQAVETTEKNYRKVKLSELEF